MSVFRWPGSEGNGRMDVVVFVFQGLIEMPAAFSDFQVEENLFLSQEKHFFLWFRRPQSDSSLCPSLASVLRFVISSNRLWLEPLCRWWWDSQDKPSRSFVTLTSTRLSLESWPMKAGKCVSSECHFLLETLGWPFCLLLRANTFSLVTLRNCPPPPSENSFPPEKREERSKRKGRMRRN